MSVDVDGEEYHVGDIDHAVLGDVDSEQVEAEQVVVDGVLLDRDGSGNPVETMHQGSADSSGGRTDTVTNALQHPRWYKLFFYL